MTVRKDIDEKACDVEISIYTFYKIIFFANNQVDNYDKDTLLIAYVRYFDNKSVA